jgi:hypothetical protein
VAALLVAANIGVWQWQNSLAEEQLQGLASGDLAAFYSSRRYDNTFGKVEAPGVADEVGVILLAEGQADGRTGAGQESPPPVRVYSKVILDPSFCCVL